MQINRFFSLLLLGAALSSAASAAEPTIQAVTFKHPDGRVAPAEIYISGEITPGLTRKLASSLESNGIERGTIYLNSVGGDLQSSIELGEYIRKAGFNTGVGRRGSAYGRAIAGSCQSACLMTFAGGVYRFADSNVYFGVHRFFSRTSGPQDLALGQILSATITGYLIRMGISPVLFERMVNAGASMTKLPVDEAVKLNLVNNGVLPPKWEIVGQAGKVFLQGEQRTWNGTGRIQVYCSRAAGLTMTAQYDAESNTRKIMADAKHLSMRLDGSFIGVASKDLVSSRLEGRFITTTFRVPVPLYGEISRSRKIGFAWLPAETSIFYGFDVPVSENGDLVFSFFHHCSGL